MQQMRPTMAEAREREQHADGSHSQSQRGAGLLHEPDTSPRVLVTMKVVVLLLNYSGT